MYGQIDACPWTVLFLLSTDSSSISTLGFHFCFSKLFSKTLGKGVSAVAMPKRFVLLLFYMFCCIILDRIFHLCRLSLVRLLFHLFQFLAVNVYVSAYLGYWLGVCVPSHPFFCLCICCVC